LGSNKVNTIMQRIKKLYRNEYTGEDITTEMSWTSGKWETTKEHVPLGVINNQTSNRAVIVGNGDSRAGFPIHVLSNSRAGLFGSKALQMYGCNALYRELSPTFLIAAGDEMVKEIADSGYCNDHIVYTNAQHITQYPGKFYLIPQNPTYNAGALATYLACFDGHKEIYLLGFDFAHDGAMTNNVFADTACYSTRTTPYSDVPWVKALHQVMITYDDVQFIRVCPTPNYRGPEEFKGLLNYSQITFQEFVVRTDLG